MALSEGVVMTAGVEANHRGKRPPPPISQTPVRSAAQAVMGHIAVGLKGD